MKNMKLCKDCKHYSELNASYWYYPHITSGGVCLHPDHISLVDGSALRSCEKMREGWRYLNPGACGPKGKLWESKDELLTSGIV